MAGEWTPTVLRNHLEILVGFAFKSERFQTQPPGIRLVRGDNVTEGSIRWGDKTRYWPELTPDLRRYQLRPGDVLIGMDGSKVGRNWTRVGDADVPCLLVQRVACLRANNTLDQGFLAALISSQMFKDHIDAVKTGSSIPHMSGRQIGEFVFRFPALVEQRAIAHILGTLDDKIELIRRMNKALEAMARALFKSWFVDFDPVRAKAEGRDPGLPKNIANLFPGSFVDSELGELPEGWGVGTLADFSSLNPEAWSKETRPAVINYIDLSNTKWGRIEAITTYARQDAPSRAQRILRPKDTIVGTVRPGNGSYAFISEDGLTGSTGFAVFRPLRIEYTEFVYLAATAAENIDALSHLADGGAYPAVRPEVVAATPVVLPSGDLLGKFSRLAKPLLAKIAGNDRESRTLAALRDALLPKLLSGEIRVGDYKKQNKIVRIQS